MAYRYLVILSVRDVFELAILQIHQKCLPSGDWVLTYESLPPNAESLSSVSLSFNFRKSEMDLHISNLRGLTSASMSSFA
jgi:hypothetical protein